MADEVKGSRLRVVSDGTPKGTRITCGDEDVLEAGIVRRVVIEGGAAVTAWVQFDDIEVDVEAERAQVLSAVDAVAELAEVVAWLSAEVDELRKETVRLRVERAGLQKALNVPGGGRR